MSLLFGRSRGALATFTVSRGDHVCSRNSLLLFHIVSYSTIN